MMKKNIHSSIFAKEKRMAKKKKNTSSSTPSRNDIAASFIADNIYRYNTMTVEDKSVTPWDLRDALISKNSGNLYEVKNTSDGDVVSINNNDCVIYAGDSAFSDAGQRGFKLDRIIYDRMGGSRGKGSGSGGSFVTVALVLLLVIIIAVAIFF